MNFRKVALDKRHFCMGVLDWGGCYRRFSKDAEYMAHTSDAMLRVAVLHPMLRHLACTTP